MITKVTGEKLREARVGVIPKPPTYRVVVSNEFSFAVGGVPPSALKQWLIKILLGWRVELTQPGERQ